MLQQKGAFFLGMQIVRATERQINQISHLLDAYRVFYKQSSDPKAATEFLRERFKRQDSVIFLATSDGNAAGFVQLYPCFSTVSLEPLYILNDLYVDPAFRSAGIGTALLRHCQKHCHNIKFKGLAIETATDNQAQKLYERLGWRRDTHCFHYFWMAETTRTL